MSKTTFTDLEARYEVSTTPQAQTLVKRDDQVIYHGPARALLGEPGEYYAITTAPHIDDDTVVRERIAEAVNLHLVQSQHASELRHHVIDTGDDTIPIAVN